MRFGFQLFGSTPVASLALMPRIATDVVQKNQTKCCKQKLIFMGAATRPRFPFEDTLGNQPLIVVVILIILV